MPSSGATFYDEGSVFENHTAHRQGGARSPNHVMEQPAFLELLGDVEGQRVLDIGCGTAEIADTLLAAGARSYVGVDSSRKMVEAAATARNRGDARVREGAMETLDEPAGSYDLVVSRMALHYVQDLGELVSKCARWLVPGGRLVLSVVHPVITAHDPRSREDRRRTSWQVDDYFVRGPREQHWMGGAVIWHHRTVEDYVVALSRAGFELEALSEAEPREARFEGNDIELERRRRIPLFLVIAGRLSRP